MKLRKITLEDYDKLIPFWRENYFVNEHDSLEKFVLFLEKNPHFSMLAEENGKIVGTALGAFDGRRGYLQKVVVEKNYRRKGLGQKLVKKVMKNLQSAGVTYIPMNVEKAAVSFYEKCGFKKTTQIPMNIEM